MTVYSSILELVRKLKVYFDDKMKRYCFFSCSVDGMTSSIYTGAQDLHNEPEDQIANGILYPLQLYLTSNMEADLIYNLEIKCSVCSLEHTALIDTKGAQPGKKRPFPFDHSLGHWGNSSKIIDGYKGPQKGLILVPDGYPEAPNQFKNMCLSVAFSIGLLIYETARKGKNDIKQLLMKLKCLANQQVFKNSKN